MLELSLANLFAWAVQVAVIGAVGIALPIILRVTSPKARLMYLRFVLVACLVLPLIQPWMPGKPVLLGSADSSVVSADEVLSADGSAVRPGARGLAAKSQSGSTAARRWPLTTVIGGVYVAGLGLRLAWLGLGLVVLSRLRRSSAALDPRPDAIDSAMFLVGCDAEFRVSTRVRRPVTFGLRRPLVLVPSGFESFEPAQQTAIAAHELLHVARRDWARAIVDEIVLSVFWFHPALWWLVEQIHLSVEQVVDRAVVRLVGARKPYLEALLKLASTGPTPVLQPASAFLKHGHLAQRVALLVREASMSRVRLAASFAFVFSVLLSGGWYVVSAFPLTSAAEPIVLTATAGARIAEAALAAEFQPASDPQTRPTVDPKTQQARPGPPPPPPAGTSRSSWSEIPSNAVRVGGDIRPPTKIKDVKPVYPDVATNARVQGVVIIEAVIGTDGKVQAVRVLRSIPLLDAAALEAVKQWEFVPTLLNGTAVPVVMTFTVNFRLPSSEGVAGGVSSGVLGGISGGVGSGLGSGVGGALAGGVGGGVGGGVSGGIVGGIGGAPADDKWSQSIDPNAVRVGSTLRPPARIKDVKPEYPAVAQSARVQGVVIVELLIGPDGKVKSSHVLRSIPLLDQAALDAVDQWEFAPTLLNGVAVPVIMTATVNFVLGSGSGIGMGVGGGVGGAGASAAAGAASDSALQARADDTWAKTIYPNVIRVGGNIKPPAKTKDVKAAYPDDARESGVQGVVILELVVSPEGIVRGARVLRSVPMLDQAAIDAVRQWEFAPTLLNGAPIPVVITVTVTFTLR